MAHRRPAIRLRAEREEARRSQEDAALALDCGVTRIYRIETRRTVAKAADVQALGFVYGMDRTSIDDLVSLVRGATVRGWTDSYVDMIPSSLSMLAELETHVAATRSRSATPRPRAPALRSGSRRPVSRPG